MIQGNFDNEVMDMVKADEIRSGLVPGARKNMYVINSPWMMIPDPFRIQWRDPIQDKTCMIHSMDITGEGEKYVMFLTYEEQGERVVNYIFEKEKYIPFGEEIEDEVSVD